MRSKKKDPDRILLRILNILFQYISVTLAVTYEKLFIPFFE